MTGELNQALSFAATNPFAWTLLARPTEAVFWVRLRRMQRSGISERSLSRADKVMTAFELLVNDTSRLAGRASRGHFLPSDTNAKFAMMDEVSLRWEGWKAMDGPSHKRWANGLSDAEVLGTAVLVSRLQSCNSDGY